MVVYIVGTVGRDLGVDLRMKYEKPRKFTERVTQLESFRTRDARTLSSTIVSNAFEIPGKGLEVFR